MSRAAPPASECSHDACKCGTIIRAESKTFNLFPLFSINTLILEEVMHQMFSAGLLLRCQGFVQFPYLRYSLTILEDFAF